MPKITLDDSPLIIDIASTSIGGLVFNRKASPHSIPLELNAKRVVMYVQVFYIGTDGQVINEPEKGIQPYTRMLVADNTKFVDMATGIQVCKVDNEYITNAVGEQVLNPVLENINYIKEYELFRQMMRTQQVIDDIITNYIQYAALVGKLD